MRESEHPADWPSACVLPVSLIGAGQTEHWYLIGRASSTAIARPALRAALATIPLARLRDAGLLDPLLRLAGTAAPPGVPTPRDEPTGFDDLDADSLIRLALGTTGSGS